MEYSILAGEEVLCPYSDGWVALLGLLEQLDL